MTNKGLLYLPLPVLLPVISGSRDHCCLAKPPCRGSCSGCRGAVSCPVHIGTDPHVHRVRRIVPAAGTGLRPNCPCSWHSSLSPVHMETNPYAPCQPLCWHLWVSGAPLEWCRGWGGHRAGQEQP